MSTIGKLLERVGEDYCQRHTDDLGVDEYGTKKVADLYNHGGLEFHGDVNYAITYVTLDEDCGVLIGAWVWNRGEDFDRDAEFLALEEDEFSSGQLYSIYKKIYEIYDHEKEN